MRILVFALMLLSLNIAHSKEGNDTSTIEPFEYEKVAQEINTPMAFSNENEIIVRKLENEKYYVSLLVIMSMLSLVISLYLLKNSSPTSRDIVVVTGLNFVVFGSIISTLIVSTTEQLGAVTGILGALGGYLFGTWSKNEKK